MMLPRWRPCWRLWRRRLCAGVTLLAYLVAALGVPLPLSAARPKKNGPPFPCQNHPCGCQSAEECWRSCCCFTAEERWAWARVHGITPPPYAEKPAPKPGRPTRKHHACKHGSTCPCCTSSKPPSRRPALSRRPCCKAPGQSDCCRHGQHQNEPCCQHVYPTGPTWLLGVSAKRCKGDSELWASTGTVLPARLPLSWKPPLTPAGWLPLFASFTTAISLPPPDPPPRSGAVRHSV